MYDVFISYRRAGGVEFARMIYMALEGMGLNVFFDYEELKEGVFNTQLYDAIENSKYFLLVLSKHSLDRCVNDDDFVRKEIVHALKNKDREKNIIPISAEGFSFPDDLPEDVAPIKDIQFIEYVSAYHNAAIERLKQRLVGLNFKTINEEKKREISLNRIENKYFTDDNRDVETRRLNTQRKLIRIFDSEVYEKIKNSYDEMVVLDIGSNRGDLIMDRLGKAPNLSKLIGLEYDEITVEEANKMYGVEGKIKFFQIDVELDDFDITLEKYMEEMGIEEFNVIHISMLLLHMKKSFILLKKIRRLLSKDGVLVIKDIDDGFNMAFPDEKGSFQRVIDMCDALETAGARHTGRQIYTWLKRAGYQKICLEKNGLNTVGMDIDEREAFYYTYFSFVLEDAKIRRDRYPDNNEYAEDYQWLYDNYEILEEEFRDSSFFFNIGFMMFTAYRK